MGVESGGEGNSPCPWRVISTLHLFVPCIICGHCHCHYPCLDSGSERNNAALWHKLWTEQSKVGFQPDQLWGAAKAMSLPWPGAGLQALHCVAGGGKPVGTGSPSSPGLCAKPRAESQTTMGASLYQIPGLFHWSP